MCGDDKDLVDGKPTGAVRVSFGYMSTLEDAQRCLQFIVDCFLEIMPKPVYWDKNRTQDSSKYRTKDISNSIYSQNLISSTFENKVVSMKERYAEESKQEIEKDVNESADEKHDAEEFKENITIEKCLDVNNIDSNQKLVESTEGNETLSEFDSGRREEFKACEGRHLSEIYLYPVKSCAAFKVKIYMIAFYVYL